MNILLVQREGVDLHHTLFASETSRMALRFYQPKKKPCGICITVSTLGSGLSLVSEMRWYIRRYVRDVLFEVSQAVFCTQLLAQDVYFERATVLGPAWPFRRLYAFRQGKLVSTVPMAPGSTPEEYHQEYIGADQTIEVWCLEDELGEQVPLEDQGDETPDKE